MSEYIELPIDQIELDKSNPRIANYLATHDEKDITSDLMALLLGTTSDVCASLRESIEANHGIIHPIVVNKRADGTYVVIEGTIKYVRSYALKLRKREKLLRMIPPQRLSAC